MNDKFELNENDGRERLTSVLTQYGFDKIIPTTNRYDEVDMYARIEDRKYVFEIKIRSKIYDEMLISTNKITAIDDRIQRYNLNGGFYACFYENSLYLFDTVHCPKRIGYQYCPKTTSGSDNTYVEKEVCYFNIENAWKFDYTDKWDLTNKPKYL